MGDRTFFTHPTDAQLVGEFASDVGDRLRDSLAAGFPDREWGTEYDVGGTPVDVAGLGEPTVLVELEWRRADPSDNAAKLFRHLYDDEVGAAVVCQVFTRYYDLERGGVSSKRENAEFVGEMAAETLDGFSYHALDLALDPPTRGGDRPDGWRRAVDEVATRVAAIVESE